MPDVKNPTPPHTDPALLRLTLDEEARAGARLLVQLQAQQRGIG